MSKIDDLKKNIPSLYKLNATTYFKAFMEAIGTSLEASSTQIQNAKEQIYVVSAVAGFLDALGSNVGVERPGTDQFYLNDTQFRALIPLLSYHPKQIHETMSSILDVFFGASHPDVFIEEINPNEIVVQVPATVPVIRDQLEGTAHLHGQSGYITKIDNVAKEVELQLENERKYLDEFNAVGTASTQYNGYYGTEGNIVYGSPLRVERGSSSLSFDKTGAGDVRTGIFGVSSITYYPLDLTGKKYFSFDIYLSDLTDVDSVEFKLFSTVANRSTDSVPVADLVVGVNRIVVDISDMTTEAGTGVDLAAVTHSAFVVVFNNAADVLA
ncbi:MAG: hypothetical protein DRQ62_04160 [Gammaproteobacteria bacterium]|nr:MAG: hypothetical protein DRQ62_04160 [Gammaproteobacteria bacterium]